METFSTKEKIIYTAVNLFSDNGYDNVSMLDIAKVVGIKASSIYNHFPSKADILKNLYEFYARQQLSFTPNLEELLLMAETKPVENVLAELNYLYPPSVLDRMVRTIVIASQRMCIDTESESFIRKYFFEEPRAILVPLFNRMIELGKIGPIDVDLFSLLVMCHAFSAAVLHHTTMRMSAEQWLSVRRMIFSLLKIDPN